MRRLRRLFEPINVGGMELRNRIVVSPMCQYSAVGGRVRDWHLVHLGSRAMGGAGLVMTEMTNVSAEGRITEGCAGLYDDEHVVAWRRIVDFVQEHTSAAIGVQLAHAGRKGSCSHPWEGPDVPLKKGLNPVLIKVEDAGGSRWGVMLEVYDEKGTPVRSGLEAP